MANTNEPKKAHKSDQETTQKVQEALRRDKNLRGYALEADVENGEAIVRGVVDTLSEKRHAGTVARGKPGVKSVDNVISLSTDGQTDDRDVEFEVAEELEADPSVNLRHIGAESSRGAVTLVGNTRDPDEVEAAKKAAAKARGVTSVTSQVKVHKELQPDELFHSQVRNDEEDNPPREVPGRR
ncbi:MAG: BON domain-containing protein [Firmicutes bacterium]|nr:BON domain-containing protein [Bacillota bacterium]